MKGEVPIIDQEELENYILDNISLDIEDNTINIVRKTLELQGMYLETKGIITG